MPQSANANRLLTVYSEDASTAVYLAVRMLGVVSALAETTPPGKCVTVPAEDLTCLLGEIIQKLDFAINQGATVRADKLDLPDGFFDAPRFV